MEIETEKEREREEKERERRERKRKRDRKRERVYKGLKGMELRHCNQAQCYKSPYLIFAHIKTRQILQFLETGRDLGESVLAESHLHQVFQFLG